MNPRENHYFDHADKTAFEARRSEWTFAAIVQHLWNILMLALLAVVWVGGLVLADLNDRHAAALENIAKAEREAARWSCREYVGRWPVKDASVKTCIRTVEKK